MGFVIVDVEEGVFGRVGWGGEFEVGGDVGVEVWVGYVEQNDGGVEGWVG